MTSGVEGDDIIISKHKSAAGERSRLTGALLATVLAMIAFTLSPMTLGIRAETSSQAKKPNAQSARVHDTALAFATVAAQTADPLPTWNNAAAKKSIVDFVSKVTKKGSADFVPVAERIAVFDNDGTLWSEQPMYFQLLFALHQR